MHHRLAGVEGEALTEVAREDPAQIVEILDDERPVEPQLGACGSHDRGVAAAAKEGLDGVPRNQPKDDEDRREQDDQHRDGQKGPGDDVQQKGGGPGHATSLGLGPLE